MPQKNKLQSLFTSLRRQGTKALAALRQEITKKEKELATLKATESRWRDVVDGQAKMMGLTALSRMRAQGERRRLDWNVLLAGLPPTFNAKEVQQKTGKPMEQVYAGLSRWVKDKKVKKGSAGSYQKLSASLSVQQKKS